MAARVGSRRAGRGASVPAESDSNGRGRCARRVMPGTSQRFVAAVDQLDNGTPVVSVMGEVDMATAPSLEQALLDATEDRTGEVIVDLTGCNFFDSTGLHALLATREQLERSNRPLTVALSNPSVLKIFQITGLDELFEIYPSLRAAAGGNGHG